MISINPIQNMIPTLGTLDPTKLIDEIEKEEKRINERKPHVSKNFEKAIKDQKKSQESEKDKIAEKKYEQDKKSGKELNTSESDDIYFMPTSRYDALKYYFSTGYFED